MHHIGFTGTRYGMTDEQKATVTKILKGSVLVEGVHHGLCVGADKDFHDIALALGIPVYGHPSVNKTLQEKIPDEEFVHLYKHQPYLIRNNSIIDNTKYLIAAPYEFEDTVRSGTWYVIRHALKRGTVVSIVYPDGEIEIRKGLEE